MVMVVTEFRAREKPVRSGCLVLYPLTFVIVFYVVIKRLYLQRVSPNHNLGIIAAKL